MALQTPRQEARRLSFSPNPNQSPYTPFSQNRTPTSHLTGTPQLHTYQTTSPAPQPSEEAEAFVSGGLQGELREICLRATSIARQTIESRSVQEVGINYVAQTAQELTAQLERSNSLLTAPTIRPATRREVAILKHHLQLELDTWTILQAAWSVPQPRTEDLLTTRLQLSTTEMITMLTIPGIVKLQLAVQWLERSAAIELKRSGGPMVNPLDDPAYRWQYTASRFHDQPVSIDFPLRAEDDPLDEIERKAETRLAREVFRLVRAGLLEDAQRVCREAGQPWRAAVLAGGTSASSMSANGVTGAARRTWRKAAKAICNSTSAGVAPHERAVCGVLSGLLDPVLSVCKSYEDELWARLTVLLDQSVEKALSGSSDVGVTDDQILQTFRECKFGSDGGPTVHPVLLAGIRKVQAYVSLGVGIGHEHRVNLLDTLSQLAGNAAAQGIEWPCRLAAQICLFLKYTGRVVIGDLNGESENLDECSIGHFDDVILCYVRFVISRDADADADGFSRRGADERTHACTIAANLLREVDNMHNAVSLYSNMMYSALRGDLLQELRESRRAKVASQTVEERRVVCLQEAGSCFNPEVLKELTVFTVDEVWRRNFEVAADSDDIVDSGDGEPDRDEMIIRSIEFLTFSEFPNYEEAMARTTSAARRFFLLQKREMARRLIAWFPHEIVSLLAQGKEHEGLIREFECWQIYFKAVTSYNDWHLYKSGNRPNAIPDSVRRAALAQPVQKEAKQKLQFYNNQLREYEKSCESLRNEAILGLQNALFFEGGLMVAVEVLGQEDSEELRAVRMCAIPQLVSLLHNVYQKSEMYYDAVNMGALVAGIEFKLYESFRPAEMKSFLAKLAESAVSMAQENVTLHDLVHPYVGTFFEDSNVAPRRDSQHVTFAD